MFENAYNIITVFYKENIAAYFNTLYENPIKLLVLFFDIALVLIIILKSIQILKGTRAGKVAKGVISLIIVTVFSDILGLKIVSFILNSFVSYGVIVVIIVFQPELRRALEKLGASTDGGVLAHLFDTNINLSDNINIDKIVQSCYELSKTGTGALFVLQNNTILDEIINSGVKIDSEISVQLLVNIFVPKTPLHDGAVIIKDNRIMAASCILPLIDSEDISKRFGSRHRAGLGISKETDAIAIIVSEETKKVSVAKDGILTEGLQEKELRRILQLIKK